MYKFEHLFRNSGWQDCFVLLTRPLVKSSVASEYTLLGVGEIGRPNSGEPMHKGLPNRVAPPSLHRCLDNTFKGRVFPIPRRFFLEEVAFFFCLWRAFHFVPTPNTMRMRAALSIAASLFGNVLEAENLLRIDASLADKMKVASPSTFSIFDASCCIF